MLDKSALAKALAKAPVQSYFEANQMLASIAAVAQQQAPPTVILNLNVHIEQILDLTVQEIQLLLGTTIKELTTNWQWQMVVDDMVPTHILAEVAYQSNYFQAIRFPSTMQNEETNLIIWTDKLISPSYVQVNDPSGRFAQGLP